MNGRFVSYLRVSTERQGRSGLGLEAQREAVLQYLNGGRWKLVAEFVEVESGKKVNRPQLAAAMAECKLTGSTLVVAKIDRLSRNLHFLTGLRDSGVEFVAADSPDANHLTVNILAAVAEAEAKAISSRTKAALAAAKARGTKLGGWRGGSKVDGWRGVDAIRRRADEFAARVKPIANEMRAGGASLRQIAAALTERGVQTSRGGAWTAAAVNAVLSAA
jgi:DNA invertase Pin-like site-specific DNA recombinase